MARTVIPEALKTAIKTVKENPNVLIGKSFWKSFDVEQLDAVIEAIAQGKKAKAAAEIRKIEACIARAQAKIVELQAL